MRLQKNVNVFLNFHPVQKKKPSECAIAGVASAGIAASPVRSRVRSPDGGRRAHLAGRRARQPGSVRNLRFIYMRTISA